MILFARDFFSERPRRWTGRHFDEQLRMHRSMADAEDRDRRDRRGDRNVLIELEEGVALWR